MGMGVGQRTGVCDLSLTRFVVLQRDIQTLGVGYFLRAVVTAALIGDNFAVNYMVGIAAVHFTPCQRE
jgi:hypothetical protein